MTRAEFSKKVWEELTSIDVSVHTKQLPKTNKRPAVDYLPWHKAWMLVKREFPASTFEFRDDLVHKADSVEVEILVTISDGEFEQTCTARLAVMDSKFTAVLLPDSKDINDSRQRCLVKALAFAGLGLNLWSGETLPVGKLQDPINAKQVKVINDLLDKTGVNSEMFFDWLGTEAVEFIPRELYAKAKVMLETKLTGSK